MAYITYFKCPRRRQKAKGSCYLESDIKLNFMVRETFFRTFRIERNDMRIALIDMNGIVANSSFIKKVNVGRYASGWMLNENPNNVVMFSGIKMKMNGKVIGSVSSGGTIFHTIFTLIAKGKFNWPDPFEKFEFNEKIISPEAALCIFLYSYLSDHHAPS